MTIRSLSLNSLFLVIAVTSFIPTYTQLQDREYYTKGYTFARNAWDQNIALFNSCLQYNDWSRLHNAQYNYQVQLKNDVAPLFAIFQTQPASSSAHQAAFSLLQSYARGVVDSCKSYDIDRYSNSFNITPAQRKIFHNYMRSLVNNLSQLSRLSYTALS